MGITFEQVKDDIWRCSNATYSILFNEKTGDIDVKNIIDTYSSLDAMPEWKDVINDSKTLSICTDTDSDTDTDIYTDIDDMIKLCTSFRVALYNNSDNEYTSIRLVQTLLQTHPHSFNKHVKYLVDAVASFGRYKYSKPHNYAVLSLHDKVCVFTKNEVRSYIARDNRYELIAWLDNVETYYNLKLIFTSYFGNSKYKLCGNTVELGDRKVSDFILDLREAFNCVPVEYISPLC